MFLQHLNFAAAVGGGDADEVSRGDGARRAAEAQLPPRSLELRRGTDTLPHSRVCSNVNISPCCGLPVQIFSRTRQCILFCNAVKFCSETLHRPVASSALFSVQMSLCVMLLSYIGCYIYRYVLIADAVELLRATYHEEFISLTFLAYWDQVRRAAV